ncbi:MAG: archease [Betaproteobacteria bacterium]|nr:archease [Betaproteobacteria bacterium]
MDTPVYHYFDHGADIGIAGYGETLERAFEAAAYAMFSIMVDLDAVKPASPVDFVFEESDVELALVTWLNHLLTEAHTRACVFARFALRHENTRWSGQAWGEPWRDSLERGVEVKGATFTQLSVTHTEHGWEARCVVDV